VSRVVSVRSVISGRVRLPEQDAAIATFAEQRIETVGHA